MNFHITYPHLNQSHSKNRITPECNQFLMDSHPLESLIVQFQGHLAVFHCNPGSRNLGKGAPVIPVTHDFNTPGDCGILDPV